MKENMSVVAEWERNTDCGILSRSAKRDCICCKDRLTEKMMIRILHMVSKENKYEHSSFNRL